MTTIEKIKAEIERQIADLQHKEDRAWDSMDEYGDEDAMWYQGGRKSLVRLLSFLDTLEEEPVSDDIEEEAYNHIRRVADAAGHPGWDWETQDIVDAFIAGAKWQKEQMLKEAVEGRIHRVGFHNAVYIKEPEWTKILDGMNEGDKIRILCLKEDEK